MQCNHKVKNKRADIFKKRQGKFGNKDTNAERTTQRHRKKMATYKSGREAWNRPFSYSPLEESTLLTPWLWTSSLQNSAAAAAAKLLQSCPTLCNPIDGSPPGFSVHGILQARTLEWVAISFSNAWKWKVKVKSLSRVWLLETPWTVAYQAPPSMGFSRQECWSGVPSPSSNFCWSHSVCATLLEQPSQTNNQVGCISFS